MSDDRGMATSVAEAVRAACVEAAVDAYEDAGIRGLCAEGRWEAALGAIRQLDLSRILQRPAAIPVDDRGKIDRTP